MAFYLSSPTGTISLQRLTQFAYTRFSFLCKILETKGNGVQLLDVVKDAEMVEESECLIEGTCKDRISHAILRLVCCEDADMSEFLLTAETLLFDFRISCMTREELCRLFRSVDRNRKKTSEPTSHFLQVLCDVRNQYSSWRDVVRNYLDGTGYFCTSYVNVLRLVASREVVLDRGVAHVPINRLRELTTDVFRKVLAHGLYVARAKYFCSDERVVDLKTSLKALFRRRFRKGLHRDVSSRMLHTDVDRLAELFPPCMAHLHRELRKKHRLSHHARVQYTLFLKEAGLPVHEALMFWRLEYSQAAGGGAGDQRGCRHDWGSNERRYTYSIRHLYGLEGSRINYRGHSCTSLQESYNGPQEEGGCTFSHFDAEHLTKLLTEEGVEDAGREEILDSAATGRPSVTCRMFHAYKLRNCLKQNSCQQKCGLPCKQHLISDSNQHGTEQPGNQMEINTEHGVMELSKRQNTCGDIESLVSEKLYSGLHQVDNVCDCVSLAGSLKNTHNCGNHEVPALQCVNRNVENASSNLTGEKVRVQYCNISSTHSNGASIVFSETIPECVTPPQGGGVTHSGKVSEKGGGVTHSGKVSEKGGGVTHSGKVSEEGGGVTHSGKDSEKGGGVTHSGKVSEKGGGVTHSGKVSEKGGGVTHSGKVSEKGGGVTHSGKVSEKGGGVTHSGKVSENTLATRDRCMDKDSNRHVHIETSIVLKQDKCEDMDTESSHTEANILSNLFVDNFSKPVEFYESFTRLVQSLKKDEA